MSISVWVGDSCNEIGTPSFFNAFFSTIYVRLKDERWGSRFPVIMREFYSGRLKPEHINEGLQELQIIRDRLREYPPDQIVWDHENRQTLPPWGVDIATSITSLANYFVTSDGKDLFDVLILALSNARMKNQDAYIR